MSYRHELEKDILRIREVISEKTIQMEDAQEPVAGHLRYQIGGYKTEIKRLEKLLKAEIERTSR